MHVESRATPQRTCGETLAETLAAYLALLVKAQNLAEETLWAPVCSRKMSTTSTLLDLVKNGARMGPIVNARMTAAATLALPYGISFAGAQSAIQAVQSGSCKDTSHKSEPKLLRPLLATVKLCDL